MDPMTIASLVSAGANLIGALKGGKKSGGEGQAPKQVQQDPFLPNQMQRLGQQNYENTRMGITDNPYYQQFLASQMQLPMMQQPPMQQPMMQSMKRF